MNVGLGRRGSGWHAVTRVGLVVEGVIRHTRARIVEFVLLFGALHGQAGSLGSRGMAHIGGRRMPGPPVRGWLVGDGQGDVMKSIRAAIVLACAGGVASVSMGAGIVAGFATRQEGMALHMRAGTVSTAVPSGNLAPLAGTTPATGRYVIQLDGPMTPQLDRGSRAQRGHRRLPPDNAYIVDLSGANPAALGAIGFVRWHAAYERSWKIDPEVGVRPFSAPSGWLVARGKALLDVTMFDGVRVTDGLHGLAEIPQLIVLNHQDLGGNPTFTVECDLEAVGVIADLPSVQFIEEAPDVARATPPPRIVQSNTLNVRSIHDRGITGQGQIVGILDSRVRQDHCSFSDTNPIGPLHRKILAYNSSTGSSSHGPTSPAPSSVTTASTATCAASPIRAGWSSTSSPRSAIRYRLQLAPDPPQPGRAVTPTPGATTAQRPTTASAAASIVSSTTTRTAWSCWRSQHQHAPQPRERQEPARLRRRTSDTPNQPTTAPAGRPR